jgi:hypothetical protein
MCFQSHVCVVFALLAYCRRCVGSDAPLGHHTFPRFCRVSVAFRGLAISHDESRLRLPAKLTKFKLIDATLSRKRFKAATSAQRHWLQALPRPKSPQTTRNRSQRNAQAPATSSGRRLGSSSSSTCSHRCSLSFSFSSVSLASFDACVVVDVRDTSSLFNSAAGRLATPSNVIKLLQFAFVD